MDENSDERGDSTQKAERPFKHCWFLLGFVASSDINLQPQSATSTSPGGSDSMSNVLAVMKELGPIVSVPLTGVRLTRCSMQGRRLTKVAVVSVVFMQEDSSDLSVGSEQRR